MAVNCRFSGGSIAAGILLIAIAAGMFLYDIGSAALAAKDADAILAQIDQRMPALVERVPQERGNNTMASMEIDGVNIVGTIELEKYGLRLPIAAGWDADLLPSMPCRFTGSIYDESLIIGASDEEGQLSCATSMEVNDLIVLTDMEGGRYTYTVEAIRHSSHADLEKLQEGNFALTIFVKDSSSATTQYLLIRCRWGE